MVESQNKQAAAQPLPGEVVDLLRAYLHGRDDGAAIWGKKALKEIVVALRHDLEAADIPYQVEGPDGPLFFDFHSLRHSYVLMLDQSGATLKEAMQLARHSDPKLTMARYGRAQLHDLGAAVERLPSLVDGPTAPDRQTLKATGTEGNSLPGLSPLAPKLAPANDASCEPLMTGDVDRLPTGADASSCSDKDLMAVDGSIGRVIAGEEKGRKEETPGDRRWAFLYWGRVGA